VIAKRSYYYLIAGLPDLVLDQPKPPFSASTLLEDLQAQLHPSDFRQLDYLRLPADNHNLLRILQQADTPWLPNGLFSEDTLRESLREPANLPAYMQVFIRAYQSQTPLIPQMSWQNQLTWYYFDEALAKSTGFLREWLHFERSLRNLLTGISCRRFQLPSSGQLIGDDYITAAIHSSPARDFGLGMEFPVLERILQWDDQAWLNREMALDAIRWQYLDELITFDYFTIAVLMAYYIRLGLLQRWEVLEQEQGIAAFRQMISNFDQRLQFSPAHE
jgi:hypothetical protein